MATAIASRAGVVRGWGPAAAVCALLSLAGCASPPEPGGQASAAMPAPRVPALGLSFAPGILPEALPPKAAPPRDKAVVCFYRPSKLLSAACTFTVYEDRIPVLLLRNGAQSHLVTSPGPHVYAISFGPLMNDLQVDLAPGSVTFLRANVWDEKLAAAAEAQALSDSRGLRYRADAPPPLPPLSGAEFDAVERMPSVKVQSVETMRLDGKLGDKTYTAATLAGFQTIITGSVVKESAIFNGARFEVMAPTADGLAEAWTLIVHAAGDTDLSQPQNATPFVRRLRPLFAAHRATLPVQVRMNGKVLRMRGW